LEKKSIEIMLVAASETICSLLKFEKILCVYFLISRSS